MDNNVMEFESEIKGLCTEALNRAIGRYSELGDNAVARTLYGAEIERAIALIGKLQKSEACFIDTLYGLESAEINTLFDALRVEVVLVESVIRKQVALVEAVIRKKAATNVVADAQLLLDKLMALCIEVEVCKGGEMM